MALDENLEGLLRGYKFLEQDRRNFLRSPSADDVETRENILVKDPNNKPMYTQSAGQVVLEYQGAMQDVLKELSTKINEQSYHDFVTKYPVSEDRINNVYVELARKGVIPQDASDGLKGIVKMARQAHQLEDAVAMNKTDRVLGILEELGSELDYDRAYHYNLGGQKVNVDAIAMKYANIHKRVAASKITQDIRKEIDKAIAEDKEKNWKALAIVERYNLHELEKRLKELEEKAKEEAAKIKKEAKK